MRKNPLPDLKNSKSSETSVDEVGLINKKWAKGLKIHLVNTKNRIKAFWGEN